MPALRDRLTRFAWYQPRASAVWCLACGHALRERVGHRLAGDIARAHTEQTGHTTTAWHTQRVEYRNRAEGGPEGTAGPPAPGPPAPPPDA